MTRADDAAARFKEGFSLFPGSRIQLLRRPGARQRYRIQDLVRFWCRDCQDREHLRRGGRRGHGHRLKYGKAAVGDDAAKERTYALVQEFITAFTAKNRSIDCTDLLGHDLRDPEQRASAHASGAVATKCPEFARDAVEILEKMI